MTAEDSIKDLHGKKPPTKEELRRSRTIAIVLGGFLVIALLAVVYGYVQRTQVKQQAEIISRLTDEIKELNNKLTELERISSQQRMIAEEQRRLVAEAALSSQKKK